MTKDIITSRLYNIKDAVTLQFLLTFNVSQGGTNTSLNAEDYGIQVVDWGDLTWDYDIENLLLVPGVCELTFTDMSGYLLGALFGAQGQYYEKTPTIEIRLNGSIEYIGVGQEDGISYDISKRTVKLSFDSNSAVLNKMVLYQDDGTANNPLGLTQTSYYRVTYLLDSIFQLIDPAIVVEYKQNWLFSGSRDGDNHKVLDINFLEIFQMIDPLFFDSTKGAATIGDVLKRLALDWCCFTGLIHSKKAFFKKLFVYDPTNVQTLGGILSITKKFKYSTIDYVKITTNIGTQPGTVYTSGADTKLEGRTMVRESLPGFFINGTPPLIKGSNVRAVLARANVDDGGYIVEQVQDPLISGAFVDNGRLVADFWYNWKSKIDNLRTDTFEVVGIGYDFTKDFNLDGNKYQIISMSKHLALNTTTIEAIYLGRLN